MKYAYITIPLQIMQDCFSLPLENGAYRSERLHYEKIHKVLNDGYRWVRSEGDFAILEKKLK